MRKPNLRTPNGHYAPANHGTTIYLHNEVMEVMLGRKLFPWERVRHKNGDTLDNRRENLELVIIDAKKRKR